MDICQLGGCLIQCSKFIQEHPRESIPVAVFVFALIGLSVFLTGCNPSLGYCAANIITATATGQYVTKLETCSECTAKCNGDCCESTLYDCWDVYTTLTYDDHKNCSLKIISNNPSINDSLNSAAIKYPMGKHYLIYHAVHNDMCSSAQDSVVASGFGLAFIIMACCVMVGGFYLYGCLGNIWGGAKSLPNATSSVDPTTSSVPRVEPFTLHAPAPAQSLTVEPSSAPPEVLMVSYAQPQGLSQPPGSAYTGQPVGYTAYYAPATQPVALYGPPTTQGPQFLPPPLFGSSSSYQPVPSYGQPSTLYQMPTVQPDATQSYYPQKQ